MLNQFELQMNVGKEIMALLNIRRLSLKETKIWDSFKIWHE